MCSISIHFLTRTPVCLCPGHGEVHGLEPAGPAGPGYAEAGREEPASLPSHPQAPAQGLLLCFTLLTFLMLTYIAKMQFFCIN